jgi:O-methyltransferase domain
MCILTRAGVHAMLTDFPWRRFERFIDIGGSSGSLLAALLQRHPHSSGILFDLPQVGLPAHNTTSP